MNQKIIHFLPIILLLSACCPTGTTVVLVPDANGKIGQVAVSTRTGTEVLSKAQESTTAKELKQAPSRAKVLSDEKIKDLFAETLAKEPSPPEHFRFYFASGSAEIAGAADEEVAKAKARIQARKSCDLSVIGHSDTVGDNSTNRGLSIRRAETVAEALKGAGITDNCFDIRFYGENDPAIPTADNVDEPRNRRVEVEVR